MSSSLMELADSFLNSLNQDNVSSSHLVTKLMCVYQKLGEVLYQHQKSNALFECVECKGIITMYNDDYELSLDLHRQEKRHQQALGTVSPGAGARRTLPERKAIYTKKNHNVFFVRTSDDQLYCVCCQITLGSSESDTLSHVSDIGHLGRRTLASWINHQPFFEALPSGELQCIICPNNVLLPNEVMKHIQSREHSGFLQDMSVVDKRSKMICTLCNVGVSVYHSVVEHLRGKAHSQKMAELWEKEWEEVSEQCEHHSRYFVKHGVCGMMCSACNVRVPAKVASILQHIVGTTHSKQTNQDSTTQSKKKQKNNNKNLQTAYQNLMNGLIFNKHQDDSNVSDTKTSNVAASMPSSTKLTARDAELCDATTFNPCYPGTATLQSCEDGFLKAHRRRRRRSETCEFHNDTHVPHLGYKTEEQSSADVQTIEQEQKMTDKTSGNCPTRFSAGRTLPEQNETHNMFFVKTSDDQLYCVVCQKTVGSSESDTLSHVSDNSHLGQRRRTLWQNHQPFFEALPSGELQCIVCPNNVLLPNKAMKHIQGREHSGLVQDMFVVNHRSGMFCTLCNSVVSFNDSVVEHLCSHGHSQKMAERWKNAWKEVPQSYEHHSRYFVKHDVCGMMCSACNVRVPAKAASILQHIVGTTHSKQTNQDTTRMIIPEITQNKKNKKNNNSLSEYQKLVNSGIVTEYQDDSNVSEHDYETEEQSISTADHMEMQPEQKTVVSDTKTSNVAASMPSSAELTAHDAESCDAMCYPGTATLQSYCPEDFLKALTRGGRRGRTCYLRSTDVSQHNYKTEQQSSADVCNADQEQKTSVPSAAEIKTHDNYCQDGYLKALRRGRRGGRTCYLSSTDDVSQHNYKTEQQTSADVYTQHADQKQKTSVPDIKTSNVAASIPSAAEIKAHDNRYDVLTTLPETMWQKKTKSSVNQKLVNVLSDRERQSSATTPSLEADIWSTIAQQLQNHKLFLYACDGELLQCIVCNVRVRCTSELLSLHITSARHTSHAKELQCCPLCDVQVTDIGRHVVSETHHQKVVERQSKLWLSMPRGYQRHRKYFVPHVGSSLRCTYCNVTVHELPELVLVHIHTEKHNILNVWLAMPQQLQTVLKLFLFACNDRLLQCMICKMRIHCKTDCLLRHITDSRHTKYVSKRKRKGLRCPLCDTAVTDDDVDDHVMSKCHQERLKERKQKFWKALPDVYQGHRKYFVAYLSDTQYCTVCNVKVDEKMSKKKSKMIDHLSSKKHQKSMLDHLRSKVDQGCISDQFMEEHRKIVLDNLCSNEHEKCISCP